MMSVTMMIAHPRECPGRKVSRATKRLYIGWYTIVERRVRIPPGSDIVKNIVRSPRGLEKLTTYFPLWCANTL